VGRVGHEGRIVKSADPGGGEIRLAGRLDGSQFTHSDFDRIVRSTFVRRLDFHRETRSTNDLALELAHESRDRHPVLVLAEEQTAGRGRGKNRWWAQRGALTFSLLIQTEAAKLPPRLWPQVSLTAGLAVCEAFEDLSGTRLSQLKWPNDVYLRQRKACGILIESPRERPGRLVMGIGINVNNTVRHALPELQATATSLCEATGRQFALVEVLEAVLVRLAQRLAWIGCRDDELRSKWRERCLLTNRAIEVDLGARVIGGVCRGIDADGALVVETPRGIERCLAGVVTKF
jgi:BirA family biotin operon repressor/biotin-[acetyl-CoA-carboxylase] ligase